jgi:hypothetical protein
MASSFPGLAENVRQDELDRLATGEKAFAALTRKQFDEVVLDSGQTASR